MTDRTPSALAGPKVTGDDAQCECCMAHRWFLAGRAIVGSVFCVSPSGLVWCPADDLESWRRLGVTGL